MSLSEQELAAHAQHLFAAVVAGKYPTFVRAIVLDAIDRYYHDPNETLFDPLDKFRAWVERTYADGADTGTDDGVPDGPGDGPRPAA